jgi:hypothetical protein
MLRTKRQELERKLEQVHRLALEPTDPFTRERLAQLIEELEFQLQDAKSRLIAGQSSFARTNSTRSALVA